MLDEQRLLNLAERLASPAVGLFTSMYFIAGVAASVYYCPKDFFGGGIAGVAFMLALAAFPFQHAAVDVVARPLMAKAGLLMFIGTFACALALGTFWAGFSIIEVSPDTPYNKMVGKAIAAVAALFIGGFGVIVWNCGAWTYLQFATEVAKADTKPVVDRDEEELKIITQVYREILADERKKEAIARFEKRMRQ